MTDACFLSPPAGASPAELEAHLALLRAMDQNDALVLLAIEDTERLLAEAGGKDRPGEKPRDSDRS